MPGFAVYEPAKQGHPGSTMRGPAAAIRAAEIGDSRTLAGILIQREGSGDVNGPAGLTSPRRTAPPARNGANANWSQRVQVREHPDRCRHRQDSPGYERHIGRDQPLASIPAPELEY